MKKTIVAIALLLSIVAIPAHAQTQVELESQYRQALATLIDLLIKQVQILQQKLVELQQATNKASGQQYTYPEVPRGIEHYPAENLLESGVIQPAVSLTTRENYKVFGEQGKQPGYYWFTQTSTSTLKMRGSEAQTGEKPQLAIFVAVGNPDKNFIPSFTCAKFGVWSGQVEPYDHWEENVPVATGSYGVRCASSESSIKVIAP